MSPGALCIAMSLGSILPSQAPARLQEAFPLDLRAVPLEEALSDLCAGLNVPYLLDSSVTPEVLQTPVRVFAAHLSAEEALRWVVRLAGLEAAFVEETLLVAAPERLPRLWRSATAFSASAGRAAAERVRDARRRRVDIAWTDTPLTRVARDVSSAFRIDLVVHPAILADAPLVNLVRQGMDLDGLLQALASELGCEVDILDGAIYARPAVERVESADGRRGRFGGDIPKAQESGTGDPMQKWVAIDRSVQDWRQLVDRLEKAAGVRFALMGAEEVPWPGVEAAGTLRQVLEAGRFAGLWTWQVPGEPGSPPGRIDLLVRPGPATKEAASSAE